MGFSFSTMSLILKSSVSNHCCVIVLSWSVEKTFQDILFPCESQNYCWCRSECGWWSLYSKWRKYATINDLTQLYPLFKESQIIRQKKATLELRLKDYQSAVNTIDDLLKINPKNVDFLIIQGISFEILGKINKSRESYKKALNILETDTFILNSSEKKLLRDLNRLMLLKLLNIDSNQEYVALLTDTNIAKYPEIEFATKLLRDGKRESIINRYR